MDIDLAGSDPSDNVSDFLLSPWNSGDLQDLSDLLDNTGSHNAMASTCDMLHGASTHADTDPSSATASWADTNNRLHGVLEPCSFDNGLHPAHDSTWSDAANPRGARESRHARSSSISKPKQGHLGKELKPIGVKQKHAVAAITTAAQSFNGKADADLMLLDPKRIRRILANKQVCLLLSITGALCMLLQR